MDTTYETFMFRRVGIFWGLDPYQRKMAATRGPQSQGPDPVATFLRIAKIAVLRALGRGIVNGLGSSPEIRGLAGLYNGQFGSNDTQQVLKSTSFSLAEVRQLCRRATPSGEDGLGEGPNALLMSMRTRDKLVSVERAANNTPTFLPDPLTGRLRYHFDGIPVYVGPAREDEEDNTLPSFGDTSSTHRSSIYALRIGGRTGIRVLHFGGDSNNHGLNIEEIAPSDTGPIGYRAHGSYTLFVPERQSVARLWHIDISSEAI